jgi:hypothetical protein
MRLLPELGLLRSDPLFDRSYPKSGSELTETNQNIYILQAAPRSEGKFILMEGKRGIYIMNFLYFK